MQWYSIITEKQYNQIYTHYNDTKKIPNLQSSMLSVLILKENAQNLKHVQNYTGLIFCTFLMTVTEKQKYQMQLKTKT